MEDTHDPVDGDEPAAQTTRSLAGALSAIDWRPVALVAGVAVVSLVMFSVFFSWRAMIIIFGMLAVHEGGHIVMGLRYGMGLRMVYITPIGMLYVPRQAPQSRLDETRVLFAGPIAGGILAVIACVGYLVTKNPSFAAVSFVWAVINAFNLLPILPLDGGQIVKSAALSRGLKPGFALIAVTGIVALVISYTQGFYLAIALAPWGFSALYREYQLLRDGNVWCSPMSARATAIALVAYALLGLALLDLALLMIRVPGANAALQFILGK